jgi:hypothetical protein
MARSRGFDEMAALDAARDGFSEDDYEATA